MPIKVRWFACIAMVLLVCVAGSATSFASTITLSGSGTISAPGDLVSVQFKIAGLSGVSGDSLSAFDVNLLFDPAALQLISSSFTDPATATNQLQFAETGSFPFLSGAGLLSANTVDAYGVSGNSALVLDSLQANSFQFLTLSFASLNGQGTSVSLDLTDPALLFLSSSNANLPVTFDTSTVRFEVGTSGVSPVPEPGTVTLVALGLGACFSFRLQQYRAGWSQRK